MAGRSIACRPTMPILPAQFGASGSTFTSATFLFVSITNVARCAAGILASNFVAFLTWPTVLDALGLFRSAGERHTVLTLLSGERRTARSDFPGFRTVVEKIWPSPA